MLSKRENALAIMRGEQPDYYDCVFEALEYMPDPVFLLDMGQPNGKLHKDSFGVEWYWPEGAPGQHPTGKNLVIEDVENWQEHLVLPDLGNLDWSPAKTAADAVDRSESFVTCFSMAGLFERSHHLMGFEDALANYLTNEKEVAELLRVLTDFKIDFIRMAKEHFNPDLIFYQDDWGAKTNVFLPPDLWRRIIKPLHTEIVDAAHACDMIFMQHADCFCQPLVMDMVDMKIDIWQGAIPQNDILEIQRITQGKLPMSGGVDGARIDVEHITEDEIRAEVRRVIDTYCPAGRFFPGIGNRRCYRPWNQEIYRDEMVSYGRQWAIDHPIG